MRKEDFYKKVEVIQEPLPWGKYITVTLLIVAIAFGTWVYFAVYSTLPSLQQLENPPQEYATQILDSDGNILENLYIKRRMHVPYDSIPKAFFNALIATEDREFYNHWGVHTKRIFQAAVKNVFRGSMREGASTLTQQLARNLYLTNEKSFVRKIKEAITSVQIEKTFTKNEILELYANTVNFGRGSYGIQVASQVFFGKQPNELSLSECAYLVAQLKAPSYYDARVNYEKAITRRNTVLNLMVEEGLLEASKAAQSKEEPIKLVNDVEALSSTGVAPHFVEMIRKRLGNDERMKGYDLYRDGLKIYTTLNPTIQRYAEEAAEEELTSFQEEFDKIWSWDGKAKLLNAILEKSAKETPQYLASEDDNEKQDIIKRFLRNTRFVDSVKRAVTTIQTGVCVVDPSTGAILAMVGASPVAMKRVANSRYSLNHVTETRRQPGSAFKPFVYASALSTGRLSPESSVAAGGFSYKAGNGETWTPKGSSHAGAVSMRTALKFSINTVAARLITQYTRPSAVVTLARKMGITTPMDPYPAIALGTEEVYLLDITGAYGAFTNQGISVTPTSIVKIEDRLGNTIYKNQLPSGIVDALSPKVCKQMVSMMRGVVDGGTASSIRKFYKHDAAGKTGTTNDYADAWFVGYTPQLVAGVWVGFDDHRIKFTGAYGQGGKAAAPIWGRLMGKVYNDNTLGYYQKMFGAKDSTVRKRTTTPVDQIEEDPESIPVEVEDSGAPADPTPAGGAETSPPAGEQNPPQQSQLFFDAKRYNSLQPLEGRFLFEVIRS